VLLVVPLRTKTLFCNRGLSQAGVWSYSIYLVHLPLIVFSIFKLQALYPGQFVEWDASSAAAVAVLTIVCLALSACTYRWIESPFLQRKARLEDEPALLDVAQSEP